MAVVAAEFPEPGRNPAFLRLWAAESISKVGDAVSFVAVPLAAIAAFDAGPGELGLLGAAQLLPIVVLGLPAGAWVDRRRSRRAVMAAADLVRGLVLMSVPVAWAIGGLSFGHLWLAVFVNACLGTFFDVAFAAYLPLLVGRSRLVAANARVEISRSAAAVLGPGAAGALVQVVAAPVALALDAVSFLASGVLLASIRRPEPSVRVAAGHRDVRAELLAGARYVVGEPHLRAITATAMINNLSRSMALVVVLVFLVRDAGVRPADVGFGLALGNTGFILGALLASWITGRLGVGRTMRAAVSCFWPGMVLLAAAPPGGALAAFVVMLFLNGLGVAVHNVNQVSVRQAVTPDHLRARVAAASRLLVFGALPLGTMLGGLLGELLGLRTTLWIAAFGLFVGSLPYRLSRVGSLRELPEALIPVGAAAPAP